MRSGLLRARRFDLGWGRGICRQTGREYSSNIYSDSGDDHTQPTLLHIHTRAHVHAHTQRVSHALLEVNWVVAVFHHPATWDAVLIRLPIPELRPADTLVHTFRAVIQNEWKINGTGAINLAHLVSVVCGLASGLSWSLQPPAPSPIVLRHTKTHRHARGHAHTCARARTPGRISFVCGNER